MLTFTAEGGAKKLKRIRFNRSLFSADSAKQVGGCSREEQQQQLGQLGPWEQRALLINLRGRMPAAEEAECGPRVLLESSLARHPACLYCPAYRLLQWYEVNKHRLAQPTGTPRVAAAAAAELRPSQRAYTPPVQQQQQQEQAVPAAAASAAGAQGQRLQQPGAVAAAAGAAGEEHSLLHFRQTSRNLSFDARELASFHERLQHLAAQQQQQPGQAGKQQGQGSLQGSPGLPPQPHRPSRLSQLSRPATAASDGTSSLPDSPFASSGGLQRQQFKQQQQGEAAGSPGAADEAVPPAVCGEASGPSRGWQSAQSSPMGGSPQQQPSSRQASGQLGELAAIRSAAAVAAGDSGASSPIRAPGGSRSSSPLSKQRGLAVGSGNLIKQASSPRSELGKAAAAQQQLFTPRAPLDRQPSSLSAAAAAAEGGTPGSAGGSEAGRSGATGGGSSQQGTPTAPAAAGAASATTPGSSAGSGRPGSSSSGFSGTIGRLRRSLTGGGSSSSAGKKK